MADDKFLPYPAEAADAAHVPPTWTTAPDTGAIEWRRRPLPFGMGGQFDRCNGNRVTLPYYVRSDKFFKAIPCILGWSTTGVPPLSAPNGGLIRRLPVRDEQGMGMVAVRVPSWRLKGSSKIKPGPGNTSRIYGDTKAPEDPAGPQDGSANPLPKLWMDDAYTAPDIFDLAAYEQQAIKQSRYVILNIEFAHAPYAIFSDTHVQSAGNPFGAGDERYRYMWGEFNGAAEWVTTKAITLKFGPGAVDANGISIAGNPCGTESGFARPTGELILHWEKVPADAVSLIFDKFEDTGVVALPAIRGPRYACINHDAFDAPVFSTVKTFPAETLMFMFCRTELRWQPHGIIEYDLHYHFQYRYGGWNKALTGQTATPQPIVRKDGSDQYQKTDFKELFRWDNPP